MKVRNILAGCCAFLLLMFASAILKAQDISGTISGTVVDSTGAAVSGATVTITNTDKNEPHVTHTNEHGEYTVPNLLVGHYAITVEAKNFKKTEQKEIMLNVHDQLSFDFKLEVGPATETITVNASDLHLETQTATQQGLVAPKEIHELPLNTRNFIQLVTLMPGVSSGSQLDTFYIGNVLPSGTTATIPFSFNGERTSAGYWTLDGADNVDRGSNLTLLDFPSIDAIEEFKVLRGQYDAEYGRSEGAQITVVTKSGGSQYHGNAYEFFRNDVMQANNALNNRVGTARPPLRYNDFGYTLGGPITIPHVYNGNNHKTYFFFSQEVRRVITYGTVTALLPTSALLAGNFPGGTVCIAFDSTGHCTATGNHISTIDPVAAAYIKDIWSKMPGVNTGANGSVVNLRNVFNGNQQLIRVDHTFSNKFSIFGRFIHDGIPTIEPGGLFTGAALPGVSTTATSDPGYNFIVHAVTTISPTLLNDGGFQYSQGAILSVPIGLDNSAASPDIHPILPFVNTLGRIPSLSMTGISGIAGFGPYNDYNRNYNVFDNQTWIHGKHAFKFGVSYNHYQKTENTAGNNVGSFSIDATGQTGAGTDTTAFELSWANFLLGRVTTFQQASIDITPNIISNQTEFYGQDSWRVLPNLTFTWGFRYSFFRQPIDTNKESTNFDAAFFDPAKAPTIDSNGLICLTAPCAGGGVPNPNYNPLNGIIVNNSTSPFGAKISNDDNGNIAPRLGFAWQPWKNGKTVIRGGYGMFYDSSLFGIIEQNIFANPPFVNTVSISNVTLDNPAAGTATVSLTPKALHATMLPSHTPYVQQVSLDVQHEFKGGFFLDVAYVGNHGTHLIGEEDINMPMPGAYVAAGLSTTILDSSLNVIGTTIGTNHKTVENLVNIIRPFKGYGPITAIESGFSSNYNGLQIEAKKQMQNFLFKVDYTWSHALTNNQTDRSTAPQNAHNPNADYGPLQQDRTQIFSADVVYSLPWWRTQQGFAGRVLGGWQISAIVSAATGLPLTVTTTSAIDPAGDGACSCSASPAGLRPDMIGNPNAGGAHTITSWFNGLAFANVPALATRPGNEGRGTVRGPGYQTWNMSLSKDIRITERTGFDFRAEAFNLFNHTNPFGVGTQLGSSTYNTITNYRDPRVLQLGLKFHF